MNIEQKLLICECSSCQHQLIITHFNDDNEPVVYVHVHLAKRSLWGRIKYAVKYIFGYQSRFGAFDEIILGPDNTEALQSVINHIKKVQADNLQLKLFNDGQNHNN